MIRDFFAGLGAGLKRDPIIWVLVLLNAFAGIYAYATWFEASEKQLVKMRLELTGEKGEARAAPANRAPAIQPAPIGTVNANANVRAAPDPNAPVLASLTRGQQIVITGTGVEPLYRDKPWVQVRLPNNRIGYIWAPLVE